MALELVLARKAIAAAVLAPEHGARILFFVRISAMFGFVVAFEVTKVLSDDRTALLEARILSWLAVVASLMLIEPGDRIIQECLAARKTAFEFKLGQQSSGPTCRKFAAADTSTILSTARIICQIGSERPGGLLSGRDGVCFSALTSGNQFRPSRLLYRGIH